MTETLIFSRIAARESQGNQGKCLAFEEPVILLVNGPTFVISDLINITLQQLHLHFWWGAGFTALKHFTMSRTVYLSLPFTALDQESHLLLLFLLLLLFTELRKFRTHPVSACWQWRNKVGPSQSGSVAKAVHQSAFRKIASWFKAVVWCVLH